MIATMGMRMTDTLLATPLRAPIALILPMFFGLSGFLVAGSLLRSKSLIEFVGLRILRIVPALAVEVLLSALLLGPLLTSFSLVNYFSDPQLYRYFLNILGDIHYELPGLFLANPVPKVVNIQLWTIPVELKCYVALSVLATIGVSFSRRVFLAVLGAGQVLLISYVWAQNPDPAIIVRGPTLVFCFLCGVGAYLWRDRIPANPAVALCSLALCLVLLRNSQTDILVAAPAVYLTCYLGTLNPTKLWPLQTGDYSYGVFLYGFPIQQAFSPLGPVAWHWWQNILICVPASLLVAICSWHLVEKKALALKATIRHLENAIISRWKIVAFWNNDAIHGGIDAHASRAQPANTAEAP
jgi:peptidoglycan/LPS O-acetylase OafA/YrhL